MSSDEEKLARKRERDAKKPTPELKLVENSDPPLFEMIHFDTFVKDFVPAPYLIKGMFQKRYLYSLTGPTGSGKTALAILLAAHVATGTDFHERKVKRGRVLYFAGENPDDIRARFIRQAEEFGVDSLEVVVVPKVIDFSDKDVKKLLAHYSETYGPFELVIVDTVAAYFFGSDENGNAQMKEHARTLRTLLQLKGAPCVIALCHPASYKDANLTVPRGGGAFLAEIDGNAYGTKADNIVTLQRHEKFRGAPWNPVSFELSTRRSEKVKDEDGTLMPMVIATPVNNSQEIERKARLRARQDQVLALMLSAPGLSQAEMARRLGWLDRDGEPKKVEIGRRIGELIDQKLVAKDRDLWKLTPPGTAAAKKLNITPDQVEMYAEDPRETESDGVLGIDKGGVQARKP